jgi:hypothetical protein
MCHQDAYLAGMMRRFAFPTFLVAIVRGAS